MGKNKTVSVAVVIPCYKCTVTLKRAVDSILNQSVTPNEIILVDDFSPDETLSFLYQLQQKYGEKLIKVLHQLKNEGPGIARNAGWELATSDYVAFLDSDDSWHPMKLEVQYKWMKSNPCFDLSAHESKKISDKEKISYFSIKDTPDFDEIHISQLLRSNKLPTRSVMLRRDLKFRFESGMRYSEDYLLWIRLMFGGVRVAKLNSVLAYSYKSDYGDSGLSAELWKMQKGEMHVFMKVYKDGCIKKWQLLPFLLWSLLKFAKRIVTTCGKRFV